MSKTNGSVNEPSSKKISKKRQLEILEAAVKVFSEKGFSASTTKEIAREAGISEGTIFKYFHTKKDLLLGLLAPVITDSLYKLMDESQKEAKVKDEEILERFLKKHMTFMRENIDLIKIVFYESHFHDELRMNFLEKIVIKVTDLLEEYFRQKVEEGVFKDINPRIAVRAFIGMFAAIVVWKDILKGDEYTKLDEDEAVKIIVDIFFNGVKKT
jgi:AcrR family transcriptional regulator